MHQIIKLEKDKNCGCLPVIMLALRQLLQISGPYFLYGVISFSLPQLSG